MADSTDDDDEDLVPIKRQPKVLAARKSLPSVDGALDDFIIQANQKLMDVTEFTAENREQQLRDEIAGLEKKLAALQEARASSASDVVPETVVKRSWGMVIGAFVLGGAIAFGATKAMQPSAPAQVASRECAPAAATPPEPPAAVAAPAPPQPPAQQVGAPAPAPATAPTPAPAPTVAAKQAPKQAKSSKTSSAPPPHTEEHHEDHHTTAETPKATETKPPPAQDGSGSDLYNPF